jgi:GGDEF domain-containing protein
MCAEQISLAIANVKLRDQLRDQSIRDVLTGWYNRRYLLETCRREFSRAARPGQSVGIFSIDVDHLNITTTTGMTEATQFCGRLANA